MPIKATISPSYRWRIGIVGIAALAFAAYCFYDGAIAYPAQKERWEAYQQVMEEHPDTYQREWINHAEQRGWDTEFPAERTDTDILTQYLMGAGCTLVGALFFGSFLMISRRFVATDEDAVWDHKKRAAWDQITDIDKSRWQTKGIGVIHFKDQGGDKRIVLDDWKFDRNATQRIMAHVEAKVGGGQAPQQPQDQDASPAHPTHAEPSDAPPPSDDGPTPPADPADPVKH